MKISNKFEYSKERRRSLILNNDQFLNSHTANDEDKKQDEDSYTHFLFFMLPEEALVSERNPNMEVKRIRDICIYYITKNVTKIFVGLFPKFIQ